MPSGRATNVRKLTDSSGGTRSATDTIGDHLYRGHLGRADRNPYPQGQPIIDLLAHRPR
jgi:hypothetical protein